MSENSEDKQNKVIPVLPLRDTVVFPKMIVPLFVGRQKSIQALQQVNEIGGKVVLVTQKKASIEDPKEKDIYNVGTLGNILQMLKLPDGTVKVLIEGVERIKVNSFFDDGNFISAQIEPLPEISMDEREIEVLSRSVISLFEEYVKISRKLSPDVMVAVRQIEDYSKLADTIASHITLKTEEKQQLLEAENLSSRFEKLLEFMNSELAMIEVENKIKNRVKQQMEKSQKEYYLNEQMKAIQKELNDGDEEDEISALKKRINNTKLSKEAKDKALAELRKLKTMGAMSSEATVVRNYLDWLLDIPWKKNSKVNNDLQKATQILEADHYGLDNVT